MTELEKIIACRQGVAGLLAMIDTMIDEYPDDEKPGAIPADKSEISVKKLYASLSAAVQTHRGDVLTCPESCVCWGVEEAMIRHEEESEANRFQPIDENGRYHRDNKTGKVWCFPKPGQCWPYPERMSYGCVVKAAAELSKCSKYIYRLPTKKEFSEVVQVNKEFDGEFFTDRETYSYDFGNYKTGGDIYHRRVGDQQKCRYAFIRETEPRTKVPVSVAEYTAFRDGGVNRIGRKGMSLTNYIYHSLDGIGPVPTE